MTHSCIDLESEQIVTPCSAERESRARWAATPVTRRLQFVRNLRHLLAAHAAALATSRRGSEPASCRGKTRL